MSESYPFREIEPKWQARWDEQRAFRAANPGEPGAEKPKYYVLDFFPYPSGSGLHVGHPLGYIATDIVARFRRMKGHNVLHPMGWDAFGLPAEQHAVEKGVHPAVTTRGNIETFKQQLRRIGLSYDWSREVATCDPDYYRWTQWIFLQIYNSWYDPEWRWTDRFGREVVGAARPIERLPIPPDVKAGGEQAVEEYRAEHRLAYLAEVPVNWCPALGTVLANEEVTADGRSERGNHPVYRRPMKQWMLRITEYAERLLSDLDALAWPEPIKLMQRNWIGRSEGAYVDFALAGERDDIIRVFTTRPDTLFGATYMVLAPEHPLVSIICTAEQRPAVKAYVEQAARKSEMDRAAETKTKTGVFTGAFAINPVNRKRIPIWVADYVLMGYGTGSIMSVPGHDKRDLAFADTHGLEVVKVVTPPAGVDWRGFEGDGISCNSPPAGQPAFEGQCDFNGLPTPDAKRRIIRWLEERDLGEGTVQYKLRDWLFSRQRYWGEPFPILHRDDGIIETVDESALPVELPEMENFRPVASDDPNAEPQTPLSRAGDWVTLQRSGRTLRRELNTMPQWAGSCWYYLRFCDPHNDRAVVGREAEEYWMVSRTADGKPHAGGVDLYLGGAEHAVLHLLYARFWHKVLYDLGHVSTPEPFGRLFNQGYIQAAAFRDARGVIVESTEVVDEAGRRAVEQLDSEGPFFQAGRPVTREFGKMGKSLKNVVNPDAVIDEYGADTLRLYEMYMGPLQTSKPWNTRDIIGVHRFLQRAWRLVVADQSEPRPSGSETSEPRPSGSDKPRATDIGASNAALNPKITGARNDGLERLLNKTIKKVTADIGTLDFNTAIAELIKFVNEAGRADAIGRDQVERFVLLLAPFAPHVAEELWHRLDHADLVARAPWPSFDDALTQDSTVRMAVQVNGKVRAHITVAADAPQNDVVTAARAAAGEALGERPVKKAIVVPRRLVNLVI